ncbi:MAG: glycosyltransferase [Steroidobacteraceae bacterium]
MDLRERPDVSVIVPVGARHSDIAGLHSQYKIGLKQAGVSYEFIYVLDGEHSGPAAAVEGLIAAGEPVIAVFLTRSFGEATAVSAGFQQARAATIMTLPAHNQIAPSGIPDLLAQLQNADITIARRWPRVGGLFERTRRAVFHGLLARVTHLSFHDLGCSARAMSRQVLEEIHLYGDQQRFLPVLADRQGFRVREVQVAQSGEDRFGGVYGPREYTRGFLDIFTVFFLVRFTKKPLRFFGMIGVVTFSIGALAQLWMIIERLFMERALADRPAFLVATLFIVLGLQIFAIGLLGELIIFVHAGQTKDYKVDRVIQFKGQQTNAPLHSQEREAS